MADVDGWSHFVEHSTYFGKDMPTLHHQPCGRTWYATVQQAVKIRDSHDCEQARKADADLARAAS